MKKTIPIIIILLCVLFLITACESSMGALPQETTAAETPAGSDISPDETTADIENTSEELESTSEEVTTVPEYFEAFPEEQKQKLLQQLEDDPKMKAFREEYPVIFDVDFLYCVSSDIFNSIIAELNGSYITLDEMIKIVGKPHLRCSLYISQTIYYWITSDNKLIAAWLKKTSGAPEDALFQEKAVYYYGYELINLSVSLEDYPNNPNATEASDTTAELDAETTTAAP